MPLIHDNPQAGQCPYCYEGTLGRDKATDAIYCIRCGYIIRLEEDNTYKF